MDLHLQKGTRISLHEQLVTQIAQQIAAGVIPAGTKLPSIRALARKLDVHHNTCLAAYKELAENGLIVLRHGSGAHVKILLVDEALESRAPLGSLDALAAFFVQQAQRQGASREQALNALEAAYRRSGEAAQAPLVFADIHADILPVFRAELQQALQRPVRAMLIEDIGASELAGRFVVSRYHCEALHQKLAAIAGGTLDERQLRERVTVVEVGSVREELSLIRQLPENALVVIFSASSIILQQAEAVVKALRGETLILRTVFNGQEGPEKIQQAEIQRILKRAQMIFADVTCVDSLQPLTRKPVRRIQAIPAHEIAKLKENGG